MILVYLKARSPRYISKIVNFKVYVCLLWYSVLMLICITSTFSQTLRWEAAGVEVGSLNAFLVTDSLLVVGKTGGDVFMSSDRGSTWQYAGNGLIDSPSVEGIVSHQGNLFIAASNDYDKGQKGIYKWISRTRSWQRILGDFKIYGCVASDSVLVVKELRSLIISRDGGNTWKSRQYTFPSEVDHIAVMGQRIFVATRDQGVFRSVDNGISWRRILLPTDTTADGNRVIEWAVRDTILLATFEKQILEKMTFRLTASSTEWSLVDTSITDKIFLLGSDATTFLAATIRGLFTSPDGITWKRFAEPIWKSETIAFSFYHRIFPDLKRDAVYIMSLSNLSRLTERGTKAELLHRGTVNSPIRDLISVGTTTYASALHGIYRAPNNTDNWRLLNPNYSVNDLLYGEAPNIYSLNVMPLALFAVSVNLSDERYELRTNTFAERSKGRFLLRSANGGASWKTIQSSPLNDTGFGTLSLGITMIMAKQNTLFRSLDIGNSWERVTTIPNISTLANSPRTLFVGTSQNGVYSSQDTGKTWQPNRNWSGGRVLRIVPHPDKSIVFALTDEGLFRSPDDGKTWGKVGGGLSDGLVTALTITKQCMLLSLRNEGMYISFDEGNSWTLMKGENQLGNLALLSSNDTHITAVTTNNTMYRAAIPVIPENLRPVPALGLIVYPSPIEQYARIQYTLPQDASIIVSVHDITGRTVAEIANGMYAAQGLVFEWNTLGIPSGVYAIRLVTPSGVESKIVQVVR
jgi:photosystem II stability/assembly factor-like uncharacterized protein